MTATPPDPTGYGRILRDERGHVIGVVEQKDATPEERALTEMNAGIYAGRSIFSAQATAGLSARNAQREYYLTDIIARAAEGIGVTAVEADFRDVAGVNDRQQLAEAEAAMRAPDQPRADGARHLPRSARPPTWSPAWRWASTSRLGRGVALRGRTKIGHGARIGDGVILTDMRGRRGRHIKPVQRRHRGGHRGGRHRRPVRPPAPRHAASAPTPTSATSWRRRRPRSGAAARPTT